MTRARVSDDKRQRIAQACNQCQARKQKCNGQSPCGTCTKRCIDCTYSPRRPPQGASNSPQSNRNRGPQQLQPYNGMLTSHLSLPAMQHDHAHSGVAPLLEPNVQGLDRKVNPAHQDASVELLEAQWARHTMDAPDSEIPVAANVRLLRDSAGRLLYAGSSACASFLQEVRSLVSTTVGPCPFTIDANQYNDDETTPPLTSLQAPLTPLPPREQAIAIINSYLTNSAGFHDIVDRETLFNHLSASYDSQQVETAPTQCITYLVLASGVMMNATGAASSSVSTVFCDPVAKTKQADAYFQSALAILNGLGGYEAPELWTVQAFALMCTYSLSASRRNAAYTHLGMAASASYTLGIHRANDFIALLGPQEVERMTQLWKSLVVLDAFTCAYIGRPPLISEQDAGFAYAYPPEERCPSTPDDVHHRCLDYCVGVSQTIRQILTLAYSQDILSAGRIQSVLDCGILLPTTDNGFFGAGLDLNPVAVLHARLMHMQAIILATRPFFMHLVRLSPSCGYAGPTSPRLTTMAKNCLIAATQVIALVHNLYEQFKLPTCDATWIVPLFTAASVLLCNDFVRLYGCAGSESLVSNALLVLDACDKRHSLINRAWSPLVSLKSIVFDQRRAFGCANAFGQGQCEHFANLKLEDVSNTIFYARCFDGQHNLSVESLDTSSYYKAIPRDGPSDWSSPTDGDASSRRQSFHSVQTGSDYLRNASISPRLTNDFEMGWSGESTDASVGWAQPQCLLGVSPIPLPVPPMTLPSSTPLQRSTSQERNRSDEEDYTGEGNN